MIVSKEKELISQYQKTKSLSVIPFVYKNSIHRYFAGFRVFLFDSVKGQVTVIHQLDTVLHFIKNVYKNGIDKNELNGSSGEVIIKYYDQDNFFTADIKFFVRSDFSVFNHKILGIDYALFLSKYEKDCL